MSGGQVDEALDDDLSLSQASEQSPLVAGSADNSPNASSASGAINISDSDDALSFDDELEKPWPATFERSISLLAGPTMDPTFVDVVTKSPKLTPYSAIRNRRRTNANETAYATPEFDRKPIDLLQPGEFKQGITKIQSLDFPGSKKQTLDAKQYRQNILKQHATPTTSKKKSNKKSMRPSKDVETGFVNSPGYQREMDADVHRKQMKTDAHGASISNEKSTFWQCVFNMSNILMGVGMLGLPYVFKSAGWVGGIFVTLTFASVAWRTSILLGRELNGDPRPCGIFDDDPFKSPTVPGSSTSARMRKPIKSFPDIAREAFGPAGTIMLSLVLYFELFSCLCIFLITIGDHLHTLFPSIPVVRHIFHVALILAVPTALLKSVRLLSYLSAVGTFATVAIVLSVFYCAITNGDASDEIALKQGYSGDDPHHTLWRTSGLPIAFGLIAFTFSGHAIVPSIYSSMERPQDFEKMISYTFQAVSTCCFIVAVSGYYMFGDTVDDQITLSLEKFSGGDNQAIQILTWLMILTAFSKFTLTAFPLALGIEEIFAPCLSTETAMEIVSSLIKLILIVLAFIVAVYVPSFSFICSLVGLICTMIVSVIFPAAAHLKMFRSKLPWWEQVIDIIFIVAGSFMTVVGTIVTIRN